MRRLKTWLSAMLRAIFRPRQIVTMAVAIALIGSLHYVTFNIDAFNPIAQGLKGFSTTDIFYKMMLASPADTSDVIVIVDITQLHDRDAIATVLEEIDSLNPAAIDVDVIFERPMDSVGDAHLRKVAGRLSNAVFSYRMMDPDRERREFTRQARSFFAEEMKLNEGSVNLDRSMVRDVPLSFKMGGKTYPSVVTRMMELLQLDSGDELSRSINFEPTVFRVIPYDSVQHYADYISNRVVMFGGAYESVDMLYTPLGQLHGIQVLCYALKTMLEMNQQKECSGFLYWLLTLVFSYLSICCIMSYKENVFGMPEGMISDLLRTTLVTSFFIFLLMTVSIAIGFWFFYEYRYNFNLTPTLAVQAFATTSADLVRYFNRHFKIFSRT